MQILYPTPTKVKTRRFGAGILRSLPSYRADHTASDDAWLIQDNARREHESRELNRRVDEMFAEAEAVRLHEAGLACY